MSRTRLVALSAVAATALAAGGVAAATHRLQTTQPASATFAAATVTQSHSATCTASDGTYNETTATYSGSVSASSDSRLAGSVQLRAHSVLNTSTGLGWMQGTFRIRGSNSGSHGTFDAVLSGGNAVGTIVGEAGQPESRLVASLTGVFSPSSGFSAGSSLGSGSAAGAGVLYTHGACTKTPAKPTTKRFTSPLRFSGTTTPSAKANGSFALEVTRDASGNVTAAKATFRVDYNVAGPVTITDLALYQGAPGSGTKQLDANAGTIVDTDGKGNLTNTVGADKGLAQAVLANPHGYYVQLDTTAGTLRAQLGNLGRH